MFELKDTLGLQNLITNSICERGFSIGAECMARVRVQCDQGTGVRVWDPENENNAGPLGKELRKNSLGCSRILRG